MELICFRLLWLVAAINALLLVVAVSCSNNLPDDPSQLDRLYPLTLIHINDFHARFEETNLKSNNCTGADRSAGKCVAGIARVYTVVERLLQEYKSKNAVYFNAGDNFQGSLWYNLLRWEAMAYFVKKLKPAVMTLGNHEFDHGPKGLAPYLEELNAAHIPTVVANLETNGDRELAKMNIRKSVVLKVGGQKIGVIGVLFDKTHQIAQTGKVTFSDAAAAVQREASNLRQQGIDKIIVLSHCGLDEDKRIAVDGGENIDLIIGGHSHSFLYSDDSQMPYDSKTDEIVGEYPVVMQNKQNSKSIPIVQAMAFGKYVGRITVYFDGDGNLKHWEGFPVYVNGSIPQNEEIVREMQLWREKLWALGSTVVGETRVRLNRDPCRSVECSLGDVVADAYSNTWTNESFRPMAMIHAGNFRNPIPIGPITNGLIIEAIPYGSTVDLVTISGQDIWNVVEHSYTWDNENRTNCLQVSGLNIKIDPSKPFYQRVVAISVRDYRNVKEEVYSPLNLKEDYFVAVPSYMAEGRDGFVWMLNASARRNGPLDSDSLTEYVSKVKVIENVPMGRVKICGFNWDCLNDKGKSNATRS